MKTWGSPAAITALRSDVRQHPSPPTVADASAHDNLRALVLDAAETLGNLAPEPIVVAAAPNRFNDVAWYDWRVVRVGDAHVEHDAYCGTYRDFAREVDAATPAVRAAAQVLERLEGQGWRDIFMSAFDLPMNDEFIAVVVQHELPWFIYASSNLAGREHVFGLWEGDLRYFGECVYRTDDELIDERGLVFSRHDDPW